MPVKQPRVWTVTAVFIPPTPEQRQAIVDAFLACPEVQQCLQGSGSGEDRSPGRIAPCIAGESEVIPQQHDRNRAAGLGRAALVGARRNGSAAGCKPVAERSAGSTPAAPTIVSSACESEPSDAATFRSRGRAGTGALPDSQAVETVATTKRRANTEEVA